MCAPDGSCLAGLKEDPSSAGCRLGSQRPQPPGGKPGPGNRELTPSAIQAHPHIRRGSNRRMAHGAQAVAVEPDLGGNHRHGFRLALRANHGNTSETYNLRIVLAIQWPCRETNRIGFSTGFQQKFRPAPGPLPKLLPTSGIRLFLNQTGNPTALSDGRTSHYSQADLRFSGQVRLNATWPQRLNLRLSRPKSDRGPRRNPDRLPPLRGGLTVSR